MILFLQAVAAVLIALILGLCVEKQGKDMAVLLTIAVCVMILSSAISCLEPVVEFLRQLQDLAQLNSSMTGILFKILGIGLISEIVSLVCADAGRSSLGKTLQILSGGVILWLSIPIFTSLLELIRSILGEL